MMIRFGAVLTFVLTAFAAHGQGFSWGIKGGVNVNDIYIKTSYSGDRDLIHPTTSFHGGLYGHLSINRRFSFIPELQFIQKGFLIRNTAGVAKYSINYIEIPTLLSYSMFKYLNIDVGQVSGFKISAYGKSGDHKVNMTKSYYTYDFALTAGIRINFNERIGLSSRYVWSLNALGKSGPILGSSVYKESNRNLLFSLTYLLKKPND